MLVIHVPVYFYSLVSIKKYDQLVYEFLETTVYREIFAPILF